MNNILILDINSKIDLELQEIIKNGVNEMTGGHGNGLAVVYRDLKIFSGPICVGKLERE